MRKTKRKAELVILPALFVVYLIALFKITIFRGSDSGIRSANLIPFNTIFEYLRYVLSGIRIIGIANLLGNLVIFFPLGYMSALLFPKMRKLTRILISAFVLSMVIEVCQYVLACGRADIDDVILNTLGGMAGYWIYIFTSRLFKSKKYAISISALMIAATCIGFFAFNNYRFLIDLPAPGGFPISTEAIDKNLSEPLKRREIRATDTDYNADSTTDTESDTGETAWRLILVNKWNYVPDDYEAELTELANGQSVDKRIYPALRDLFEAARRDGVYPVVVSGYRTAEEQQRLLDEKIADYEAEGYSTEDAVIIAGTWVAAPDTSEHQMGIAVDINADGINSTGYEVYEWLGQNAFKFGFIRRYPPDKTEITGVINEPWHYRYVGVKAAAEIYNRGICLEEYLILISLKNGDKKSAQNP